MTRSGLRALALFLGGFTSLSLLAQQRCASLQPNLWWIDLRGLPDWLAALLLSLAAVLFLALGLMTDYGPKQRWLTAGVCLSLLLMAVANVFQFFAIAMSNAITVGMPVPFSLLVVAGLSSLLWLLFAKPQPSSKWLRGFSVSVAIVACGIGFPLAQMLCFGRTDYRRPADAIVVFGCRVYSDGQPSLALADRVRTGCELFREGLAPQIVFSGGPGDGDIHETAAMRLMALELGVPDAAIVLDPQGLSTWATVQNTSPMFAASSARRVLAVSHFYHLPRVKLTYQSRGWDVFTVPARETRSIHQLPFNMAREVLAFWAYFLRVVVS